MLASARQFGGGVAREKKVSQSEPGFQHIPQRNMLSFLSHKKSTNEPMLSGVLRSPCKFT